MTNFVNLLLAILVLFNNKTILTLYAQPKIVEKTEENIRYDPTWESLDTRPLPKWFDAAKIGIFVHWGVFSVPSFEGEWFWEDWLGQSSQKIVDFMDDNYPKGFSYQEFAKDFTAEFFDPNRWAELFKKSGARYVVLTSKHHEGYTLWPSAYSFGWNAKDIGPHRDLVGDLAHAVRDKGLVFGLYHSLYEWFNPMYLADKNSSFAKKNFVKNKILPEMLELIENYKPWVLWSDGDWEAKDSYWNSTEFLAWLYNDSPVRDHIVVNDRWGIGIPCKHGDFYSCKDRYNPGILQKHKWENAMTIDKESWGFRRNANLTDYLTTHDLIKTLAETVSCGGNILINVGPTREGIITPIFEERLLDLGKWLEINGEAIYRTKPWTAQNDTLTGGVWYTTANKNVYAVVLHWPRQGILRLQSPLQLFTDFVPTVTLLGNEDILQWAIHSGVVDVQFPEKAVAKSNWAWVLKIVT